MYVRRKVFSVMDIDGEQKLFSVNEVERIFSEEKEDESNDEEKKLRLGDEIALTVGRIRPKFVHRANRDMLDRDIQDSGRAARITAGLGAASYGVAGGALGHAIKGGKGAALGAAAGTALGAGLGYGTGKLAGAINKGIRRVSSTADFNSQREADRAKVNLGEMSREEYAEIYGRRGAKKKK